MRKEIIEDLEGEIWIKNNGYEISNKGRIITKLGKLSRAKIVENEYVGCNVVFEDGTEVSGVHRAVAYAFIPNPNNLPEVNHIDGIKHHNWVENLEWCTKKENQDHETLVLKQRGGENNYHNKLTNEIVIEIYNLCKEGKMKYKDIGSLYNTEPSAISRIATGADWRHLGLPPLKKIRQGTRRNL